MLLLVPADVLFEGSFTLTLPDGFSLNDSETKLSDELSASLELTLTPQTDGTWLFTVDKAPSVRSSADKEYRKLVDIAYTIDGSVATGDYAAQIKDLSFTFDDGTTIEEAEVPVKITVAAKLGISSIDASSGRIYFHKQVLYVDTPVAERINVYSITGTLLYQLEKPAGEVSLIINRSGGILIVKGSSGWTRKVKN